MSVCYFSDRAAWRILSWKKKKKKKEKEEMVVGG